MSSVACSANKARTQEQEMLARANEERKEASGAVSTAAQVPVRSSQSCVKQSHFGLHDDTCLYSCTRHRAEAHTPQDSVIPKSSIADAFIAKYAQVY